MNTSVNKSNFPMEILLRWVKVYIALAFATWKMSCLYIYGQHGLACDFKVSAWSRLVEAGYVIGVLILAGQAVAQVRSDRQQGRMSLFFFAGLGLVFLLVGSGIPFAVTNSIGSLVTSGINGLIIYLSWKAWRQVRSRALVCLFWGFLIDLARNLGVKCYAESTSSSPVSSGNSAAFWVMVHDFGWIALHAGWLVEFYWLGGIVSSVLIATGMLLLLRQVGAEKPPPPSPNVAKYMATAVLFLLIGVYPSLAFFGSPGFLTAIAVNLVVFVSSLVTLLRGKKSAFAWWVWASGITIMTTLARQFHHAWTFPPRVNDQVWLQLLALGGLLVGIFWVGGFIAIVGRLSVSEPSPRDFIEPVPKTSVVWFPRPPSWMRSRLAVIISAGVLIAGIIFFRQHDPSEVFSLEPKYEGHTLSYWMDHWYSQPWGGAVNGEAEAALQSMGAKAVPLLVDWIGRPYSTKYVNILV